LTLAVQRAAGNVRITARLARSQKGEQLFGSGSSSRSELQVKSTGPELQPAELQARNPETRTIVLSLPEAPGETPIQRSFPGNGAARTRTIHRVCCSQHTRSPKVQPETRTY